MKNDFSDIHGLNDAQVLLRRKQYGRNEFSNKEEKGIWTLFIEVVSEPMFLLLISACMVYFLVGQHSEGIIMLIAMFFVASISFFQEGRSRKALDAVKKLSQPKAKVYRNGKLNEISSEELVVDDLVLIEEGEQIPVDGILLNAHDFSVDESILTGESFPVSKDESAGDKKVFLGSTVRTGNAVVQVTEVGMKTMLGKLGKSIEDIHTGRSRFQKEIRGFLRIMTVTGILAFLFVFGINYFKSHQFLTSLLFALALAMSILPEEIPVAFSTFMALGSWRLLKEEVLAKDPQIVETLGSSTVICMDKTGTITENRMSLARVFSFADKKTTTPEGTTEDGKKVIACAMWASEPSPFDPMEITLHEAYTHTTQKDERKNFEMVHEYPLTGTPPAMTHIYRNQEGRMIIACKGGAESIIRFSQLTVQNAGQVLDQVKALASEGYRVLGVASAEMQGNNFPENQQNFPWKFEGLVGFYDPPKSNIKEVLQQFYKAHIQVKIITGDFPETTRSIAREIGFKGAEAMVTGTEVMGMQETELQDVVKEKNIFARMFPEAKLKVVNALKTNGEIVAMTGDGVNDGPALKAADIGVSMGSRGTEIARRAASVVLLSNDVSKLFLAIIIGRKIYSNLKKAIRYILSIHISIILSVLMPLLLGWKVVNIFSPIHIIFFELIMGPTCSIIYENEPMEKGTELNSPRAASTGFLNIGELLISIVQGLFISTGVLLLYYFLMSWSYPEKLIRAMAFTTIVLANIFLTLENRSFRVSVIKTMRYKNSFIPLIITLTAFLLGMILYIRPVRNLFLLDILSPLQFLTCLATAFFSVAWIEIYKLFRKL